MPRLKSPLQLGSLIALLTLFVSLGCGSEGSDARDGAADVAGEPAEARSRSAGGSSGIEVLGTIQATVDGESRTWYVVNGETGNGRYASALWMEWDEGERMVTVGGYDTDDPPIDTFESDLATGSLSFGDYDGSAIVLSFPAASDESSLSVALPDSEGDTTLAYMPVATTELAGIYLAEGGSLEVRNVSFDGATVRLEGRFEGVFRTVEGDGPIRIEDGRFEVANVPAADELQP